MSIPSYDVSQRITKPLNVETKLSVKFDNETNEYTGLPGVWKELLDMPLASSGGEGLSQSDYTLGTFGISCSKNGSEQRLVQVLKQNTNGQYLIQIPNKDLVSE